MLLHMILAALGPIAFGMVIGWVSGKTGFINQEYAKAYAEFIIKIALPLALFLAAAKSSSAVLLNLNYFLALAAGLMGTYIIGFLSGKFIFKHDNKNSIVQALSVSFPDMAFCGPPVLLATIGSSGLIAVVAGNLIYTTLIIPFTLLAFGNSQMKNNKAKTILRSFAQPLIILTFSGALLAIFEIRLPEILQDSIDMLGKTTGGISVFFLSLLLSTIKLKITWELLYNVFIKNIVQGALIIGAGLALGLHGDLLKSAFIIGVLPTAVSVPALAMANKAKANIATETVFLSTLVSLFTIIGAITIIEML